MAEETDQDQDEQDPTPVAEQDTAPASGATGEPPGAAPGAQSHEGAKPAEAAESPPISGDPRLDELMAKRKEAGLSDAEAEELGELLAKREGRDHTSARSLKAGSAGEDQP